MSLFSKSARRGMAALFALSSLLLGGMAAADTGPYLGGSLGSATIKADFADPGGGGDFTFSENDYAWKLFAGYSFDLPVIRLGIEGGYRDLGGPGTSLLGEEFGLDIYTWDVFGVAGFDLGVIDLFGKAGFVTWDAEATLAGLRFGDDDGTDPAYGVGAAINLGSLQLRAEYEMFDISDVDDLYMVSAGFVYTFQ